MSAPKSGFLEKRNEFGIWQKRYFILDNDQLAWSKPESAGEKLLNGFNMTAVVDCHVVLGEKSECVFRVDLAGTGSSKYTLRASAPEEAQAWVKAIRLSSGLDKPEIAEKRNSVFSGLFTWGTGGSEDATKSQEKPPRGSNAPESPIATKSGGFFSIFSTESDCSKEKPLPAQAKDEETGEWSLFTSNSSTDKKPGAFGVGLFGKTEKKDESMLSPEASKAAESAKQGLRSVGEKIGVVEKEDKGFIGEKLDELDDKMTLSKMQRIKGFVICMAVGFGLSFLASLMLFSGSIAAFAIIYTLGNIVSLFSSMFLSGPWKHVKAMFERTRLTATCIYLAMMGITLFLGIAQPVDAGAGVLLILIACAIQYLALAWYTLSFIPYARKFIKKWLGLPDLPGLS
eukprot:Rmarinus@m.14042